MNATDHLFRILIIFCNTFNRKCDQREINLSTSPECCRNVRKDLFESSYVGLQDLPYQLKNLFGQTIPLKIVVPNTRIRLVTLVGTILLGPTPRVATGLTRGSTVGTPRAGTGSTSTSSTGQVRRWVWSWPDNRLQNLLSQIIVIFQSNP